MLFGISIHALHEESDVVAGVDEELCVISIHALHEESDFASDALHFGLGISIHALHEESDAILELFTQTRSKNFNPRSP